MKEQKMSPNEKQKAPEELVREMIENLERESEADWTQEFSASGGKTTRPPNGV
jgi:hypothetical protein